MPTNEQQAETKQERERCPKCGGVHIDRDFDESCGFFYTCKDECGHQWSYSDENRTCNKSLQVALAPAAPPAAIEENVESGVWFRSACSGLLYRARDAAGDVSQVVIDGSYYSRTVSPANKEIDELSFTLAHLIDSRGIDCLSRLVALAKRSAPIAQPANEMNGIRATSHNGEIYQRDDVDYFIALANQAERTVVNATWLRDQSRLLCATLDELDRLRSAEARLENK